MVYTEKLRGDSSAVNLEKNLLKISKASDQMRNIVSGLQEYVWLNDILPVFESINLESVLKKVERKLENEFAGQLILETDTLPVIKADAKQLQSLFYHILINELKLVK